LTTSSKQKQFNRAKGGAGEGIAGIYLKQHGFELVANNYRNKHGEIDIIAIKYCHSEPQKPHGARNLGFSPMSVRTRDSSGREVRAPRNDKVEPIYHFIEVKFRLSDTYGHGREAVGKQKQKRIRSTAQYYLIENGLHDRVYSCFDVIEITGTLDNPQIEFLENCF
jgi:Holliday junction resolvase-like predicted endonuclease